MRKSFTLIIIATIIFFSLQKESFAQKVSAGWQDAPYNRTFIKNNKEQPNFLKQQQFRGSAAWLTFAQKHTGWNVIFDERNGMPHRAYGGGIKITTAGDAAAKAMSFIKTEMSSFNIISDNLVLRNAHDSKKYQYVDYYQNYSGLEVLNSRVTVRMTLDGQVILYGADVFNDISMSTSPQLSADVISGYAVNGLAYEITGVTVDPLLKILPVPADGSYEYHLVYKVTVSAKNFEGYSARYYTLVDANNGDVLYRHDEIDHLNDLLTAEAQISDPNPWEPTVMHQLPYMRVRIGGTDYYTDAIGNLSLAGISLPVSSTLYLQGTWCKVVTGNNGTNSPSFTQTLNAGSNTVNFTTHSSVQERSAYYHVNVIHDFMKSFMPTYTEMDVQLLTYVDRTDGTCNADYNGVAINFYSQLATGCYDLALAGDVVYHEYSHGTDNRFYSLYSDGMDNGAMREGYSDVWAIALTDNPILGVGISDVDPAAYVRRFDINKKVYPQDIHGEGHDDGEIICGAWYDTRLNLGDVTSMMTIFAEALNGLADGYDGSEGSVFRDVLLDALAADDDNGNINDGTPHDTQILTAFALHGITLIGSITFAHTEPVITSAAVPVTIEADINLDFPVYFGSATCHYKINTAASYSTVLMNLVNGSTYEAILPAQPPGTILAYYFTVEDIYSNIAFADPPGIIDLTPDQNIPYFLLCGFTNLLTEDFDNSQGYWIAGDPGDQASTGLWDINQPEATYQVTGDPNSLVQTGTDHTTGGVNTNVCAFTGNSVSVSDLYNAQDVDEGATTLYSPVFDLSSYINPAISYYRWYTNEASANPRNDHWKVFITNDDVNWMKVEWNNHPQRAWRNFVFHVSDYVTPNSTVKMKFVAEDSVIAGANLSGGSIVEAAVDDLHIWNEADNVGVNNVSSLNAVMISPNPAAINLTVKLMQSLSENATIEMLDAYGKVVYTSFISKNINQLMIPVKNLESGIYTLHVVADNNVYTKKIVVQH